MRQTSAIVALAMAGLVAGVASPAQADTCNLAATVNPGAEIFLTPELKPTAAYRGSVLVRLEQNPSPVEIKISDCQGQYLGAVSIPANDHTAYAAAQLTAVPPCIRYLVKNPGAMSITISGVGYY
ncbi:hypothetical protein ABT294_12485 [Nonomuraea sp. NPDC000554]|uniref:hypothetical protein n=1 Tax=Nonomuraea sp. NPDC000554 TaxID=3154259 RepID=UPI003328EB91